MDREIKPGIFEVENAEFINDRIMREKYRNKFVIVSNVINSGERSLCGAKVRYYSDKRSLEILNMMHLLDKLPDTGQVGFYDFFMSNIDHIGGLFL